MLKKVSGGRVVGCHFVFQTAKRLLTLNFKLLNLSLPSSFLLLQLISHFSLFTATVTVAAYIGHKRVRA
jgi:hypothetical protein